MHPVEERLQRPHVEERRWHAPIEERIESRLPPCPLRIQCESQSLILPPPLTLPSSSAMVPQPWCRSRAGVPPRPRGGAGEAQLGGAHRCLSAAYASSKCLTFCPQGAAPRVFTWLFPLNKSFCNRNHRLQ